jgi:hypothetical protein
MEHTPFAITWRRGRKTLTGGVSGHVALAAYLGIDFCRCAALAVDSTSSKTGALGSSLPQN